MISQKEILSDLENTIWDDISQYDPKIYAPDILGLDYIKNNSTNKIAMQRIETSDIAFEEMREFYSNQWSYTTGHPMMRLSTITWRDYNKGFLFEMFSNAIDTLQNEYPENAYWKIYVDIINYNKNTETKTFFGTEDAILVKISSVTFDQNADGEFLQFSTTFMHSHKKPENLNSDKSN